MTNAEIRSQRQHNQRIIDTDFKTPLEIVSWMGAMQAQEYAMAKWAIGLRSNGLSNSDIEASFNKGEILRTHLLRPTWHFVAPADIRWMLALTAPRVHQVNSYMYRKMGYDNDFFNKTNDILGKALEGEKHLTRTELQQLLKHKNIHADGVGLSCIMMHAELDGIICSGPRKGKQFTYALLDERVPAMTTITRQEALFELSLRYFTSRSPATLQDFVTWSGLTMKDARKGAALLPDYFLKKMIDSQEYIFYPNKESYPDILQPTFLMPDYDEYGMGYKNRDAIILPETKPELKEAVNAGNYHMIVIEGMIAGTWKKVVKGKNISVESFPFFELNGLQQEALKKAEERFTEFVS